jgi:predicted PurR-regulated permease PerM
MPDPTQGPQMGEPKSPPWGTATKSMAAAFGLVLAVGLLWRFSSIIPLLVVAGILSFLIVPLARFVSLRTRLPWALSTNLCFLLIILLLLGASTATGLAVVQQLQALFITLQRILVTLPASMASLSQNAYVIGPWVIDLARFDLVVLAEQALGTVQPVLGQASGLVRSLASVALESLARLAFVLAVAYFLTLDYKRLQMAWQGFTIPGYEGDLDRLRRALNKIWDSFLRGQLLIVLITGILTSVLMTALGVRFSVGLGVLAGMAKFVPIVGPVAAGAVAALVAVFQPDNWFSLSPLTHAVVIIISVIVLDQSIDYLLLPRIMGSSLNLHPVVILVAAIVGASLAGVIGLLLSAPSTASLMLLTRYTFRKMVDLSPWDPPIDAAPKERPSRLLGLLRRRRQPAEEGQDAG